MTDKNQELLKRPSHSDLAEMFRKATDADHLMEMMTAWYKDNTRAEPEVEAVEGEKSDGAIYAEASPDIIGDALMAHAKTGKTASELLAEIERLNQSVKSMTDQWTYEVEKKHKAEAKLKLATVALEEIETKADFSNQHGISDVVMRFHHCDNAETAREALAQIKEEQNQ